MSSENDIVGEDIFAVILQMEIRLKLLTVF